MHPASNHCLHALFQIIGFTAVTICLSNTSSLAQENPFIEKASRSLNVQFYMDEKVLSQFELTETQKVQLQPILEDCQSWVGSEHYFGLHRADAYHAISEINLDFYRQVDSVLNEAQKTHFKRFMSARYFSIEGRVKVADHTDNPTGFLTPPWYDKEVATVLGISKNQFEAYHNVLKTHLKKYGEEEKIRKKAIKDFFSGWQKEISALLTEKQKNKAQKAIGKEFIFGQPFGKLFTLGYKKGIPCFTNQKQISISGQYMGQPKLFLLSKIHCKLNSQIHPDGLLALLEQNSLQNVLELSEEQREKISEISEQYFTQFPYNQFLSLRNTIGIAPPSQKYELTQNEKHFVKATLSVLSPLQQRRLREIWNRIIINLGWKEVPFTHPAWTDHLKLSKSVQQKIEIIRKQKVKDFEVMVAKLKRESSENRKLITKKLSQILTDKQKTAAKEIFGNYWMGEGLEYGSAFAN